jgi:hypothetical protein
MAFSPTDPVSAHSLWLQLRSTKPKKHRRPRWRRDWAPLWVPFLLLVMLVILYAVMPSNDAVTSADGVLQEHPMLGALVER